MQQQVAKDSARGERSDPLNGCQDIQKADFLPAENPNKRGFLPEFTIV